MTAKHSSHHASHSKAPINSEEKHAKADKSRMKNKQRNQMDLSRTSPRILGMVRPNYIDWPINPRRKNVDTSASEVETQVLTDTTTSTRSKSGTKIVKKKAVDDKTNQKTKAKQVTVKTSYNKVTRKTAAEQATEKTPTSRVAKKAKPEQVAKTVSEKTVIRKGTKSPYNKKTQVLDQPKKGLNDKSDIPKSISSDDMVQFSTPRSSTDFSPGSIEESPIIGRRIAENVGQSNNLKENPRDVHIEEPVYSGQIEMEVDSPDEVEEDLQPSKNPKNRTKLVKNSDNVDSSEMKFEGQVQNTRTSTRSKSGTRMVIKRVVDAKTNQKTKAEQTTVKTASNKATKKTTERTPVRKVTKKTQAEQAVEKIPASRVTKKAKSEQVAKKISEKTVIKKERKSKSPDNKKAKVTKKVPNDKSDIPKSISSDDMVQLSTPRSSTDFSPGSIEESPIIGRSVRNLGQSNNLKENPRDVHIEEPVYSKQIIEMEVDSPDEIEEDLQQSINPKDRTKLNKNRYSFVAETPFHRIIPRQDHAMTPFHSVRTHRVINEDNTQIKKESEFHKITKKTLMHRVWKVNRLSTMFNFNYKNKYTRSAYENEIKRRVLTLHPNWNVKVEITETNCLTLIQSKTDAVILTISAIDPDKENVQKQKGKRKRTNEADDMKIVYVGWFHKSSYHQIESKHGEFFPILIHRGNQSIHYEVVNWVKSSFDPFVNRIGILPDDFLWLCALFTKNGCNDPSHSQKEFIEFNYDIDVGNFMKPRIEPRYKKKTDIKLNIALEDIQTIWQRISQDSTEITMEELREFFKQICLIQKKVLAIPEEYLKLTSIQTPCLTIRSTGRVRFSCMSKISSFFKYLHVIQFTNSYQHATNCNKYGEDYNYLDGDNYDENEEEDEEDIYWDGELQDLVPEEDKENQPEIAQESVEQESEVVGQGEPVERLQENELIVEQQKEFVDQQQVTVLEELQQKKVETKPRRSSRLSLN